MIAAKHTPMHRNTDIPIGGEHMGLLWTVYYVPKKWRFSNVDQTSDGSQHWPNRVPAMSVW